MTTPLKFAAEIPQWFSFFGLASLGLSVLLILAAAARGCVNSEVEVAKKDEPHPAFWKTMGELAVSVGILLILGCVGVTILISLMT